MTDYTKTTDFAIKDTLSTGDPNKVASGAEVDAEFDNIATSSATKANKIGAPVAGNLLAMSSSGDLQNSGITSSEAFVLDGATAGTVVASKAVVVDANKHIDTLSIADGGLKLGASGSSTAVTATAAELNLLDGSVAGTSVASKVLSLGANKDTDELTLSGATASTATYFDANKKLTSSSVTATELGYLSGVTSAIQTQLDTLAFRGAILYLTGTVSVTVGTYTVSWTGASTDTDSFWASGSPTRITIPSGVSYVQISCNVGCTSSTMNNIQITRNGLSTFMPKMGSGGTPNYEWINLSSGPIAVSSGDYFEVTGSFDNPSTVDGLDCYFSLQVLG